MHWVAPSEKDSTSAALEKRLWDAADRHAIGQVIRSSSSTAANYVSACRAKSKADFISKLGTVGEEADETGFWLEMLRDILQLRTANDEFRMPDRVAKPELRKSN